MYCEYENFFTEVPHLENPTEAPTKQHEIYFNESQMYIKKKPIFTPSEVIGCLSNNYKLTHFDLNRMEIELKLFSVTYLSEKSNIGYPAFQFDLQAGITKPVISSILKPLNGMYKNWDLAFWLNSYFHDLNGSIIEVLDSASLKSLDSSLSSEVEILIQQALRERNVDTEDVTNILF